MADSKKHTEGPWERVDPADYAEIHPAGKRLRSAIALVARPEDADLVAAAPEMFDELDVRVGDLVMLRKAIEAGDPKAEILIRVDDMLKETRAILAKAEGRS